MNELNYIKTLKLIDKILSLDSAILLLLDNSECQDFIRLTTKLKLVYYSAIGISYNLNISKIN